MKYGGVQVGDVAPRAMIEMLFDNRQHRRRALPIRHKPKKNSKISKIQKYLRSAT